MAEEDAIVPVDNEDPGSSHLSEENNVDDVEEEEEDENDRKLKQTLLDNRVKRAQRKAERLMTGRAKYIEPVRSYVQSATASTNGSDEKPFIIRPPIRSRYNYFGNRLPDWNDNHNASYTQALQQLVQNGNLHSKKSSTDEAKITNNDPYKMLQLHRKQLVQEDLEALQAACIAEAFYCMNQLCGEGISLSSALRGKQSASNDDTRGFIELDVNSSMDAFYETYLILSLTKPWVVESQSRDADDLKFKKQLDDIHEEMETTRKTFVAASATNSGITKRSNYRGTLQDVQDVLLKLSSFVSSCIRAGTETKSLWKLFAKT